MEYFELTRDWETPFTKFHKGHFNDVATWAKVFGISEVEFYEYLTLGQFANWLKPLSKYNSYTVKEMEARELELEQLGDHHPERDPEVGKELAELREELEKRK